MKSIPFYKYQGTGNDFILLDQREDAWIDLDNWEMIQRLCDRKFGIGADGLIMIVEEEEADFRMIYFNADGKEGSMCGNGGRCAVAFAHFLGIINTQTRFKAVDGWHDAKIESNGLVHLKMGAVHGIEQGQAYFYLNTGSPHYVVFTEELEQISVAEEGRKIRYSDRFKAEGTNVNFVAIHPEGLEVATYERGVEAETLSCGTGVTAAAIAFDLFKGRNGQEAIKIQTKGGALRVQFDKQEETYQNIWLSGPAEQVFVGQITG